VNREQLEHLIRAAGGVLGEDTVIVLGSQAILASFADGLPTPAVISLEADFLPLDDPDETKADRIAGDLGEGSPFQEQYGIYADGVGEQTARFPAGWRERLVPLKNENTNGVTGLCIEPHDLVISKLLADRPKDLHYCRALLDAGYVKATTLRQRIPYTDATETERSRITDFLHSY
jgi:Nucleotidyltransferase of unknown function (DUF6036)